MEGVHWHREMHTHAYDWETVCLTDVGFKPTLRSNSVSVVSRLQQFMITKKENTIYKSRFISIFSTYKVHSVSVRSYQIEAALISQQPVTARQTLETSLTNPTMHLSQIPFRIEMCTLCALLDVGQMHCGIWSKHCPQHSNAKFEHSLIFELS